MRGVVAVIQARLGSTRLPGKVLADLAGRSLLAHVVERARAAAAPERVLVATSTRPEDEAVAAEALRCGAQVFRGSELDVLERFAGAAAAADAAHVVRLTADCPLLDPALLDEVVRAHLAQGADYTSNGLQPGYPRGLDVEVCTRAALEQAAAEAAAPHERAHVTAFIYARPERFRLHSVRCDGDHSALRWTVDTPEDLAFVRAVHARLGPRPPTGWRAVLELLAREPALAEINRGVRQKELREG